MYWLWLLVRNQGQVSDVMQAGRARFLASFAEAQICCGFCRIKSGRSLSCAELIAT